LGLKQNNQTKIPFLKLQKEESFDVFGKFLLIKKIKTYLIIKAKIYLPNIKQSCSMRRLLDNIKNPKRDDNQ
jgi:hypothetical protein